MSTTYNQIMEVQRTLAHARTAILAGARFRRLLEAREQLHNVLRSAIIDLPAIDPEHVHEGGVEIYEITSQVIEADDVRVDRSCDECGCDPGNCDCDGEEQYDEDTEETVTVGHDCSDYGVEYGDVRATSGELDWAYEDVEYALWNDQFFRVPNIEWD